MTDALSVPRCSPPDDRSSTIPAMLNIPFLIIAASLSQETATVAAELEQHDLMCFRHGPTPDGGYFAEYDVELWRWAQDFGLEDLSSACAELAAEVARVLERGGDPAAALSDLWTVTLTLTLPLFTVAVSAEANGFHPCRDDHFFWDDDMAEGTLEEGCYHCDVLGECGFLEQEVAEYYADLIARVRAAMPSAPRTGGVPSV
jgi:hypothetical protein